MKKSALKYTNQNQQQRKSLKKIETSVQRSKNKEIKLEIQNNNEDSQASNQNKNLRELQQQLNIKEELQQFEYLRNYLIQYEFLIAKLKRNIKNQEQNIKEQFQERLDQFLELNQKNFEQKVKYYRQISIKYLDDVLNYEHENMDDLYIGLDNLLQFFFLLEGYMKNCIVRIQIEEGIIVDIESINKAIEQSQIIMKRIHQKFPDFDMKQKVKNELIQKYLIILQQQSIQVDKVLNQYKIKEHPMVDELIQKSQEIIKNRVDSLQRKILL